MNFKKFLSSIFDKKCTCNNDCDCECDFGCNCGCYTNKDVLSCIYEDIMYLKKIQADDKTIIKELLTWKNGSEDVKKALDFYKNEIAPVAKYFDVVLEEKKTKKKK